jgi:alanine racemase
MDMLTIDLSQVEPIDAGAPVELWGPHIPVDELAERVGTIGYELLSGLPARVREAAAVDEDGA